MDETDKLVEALSAAGSAISDEDRAYQMQLQEALYASSSSCDASCSAGGKGRRRGCFLTQMQAAACTICMEPGGRGGDAELLRLGCSHAMCVACLRSYVKVKVEEKVGGGRVACAVPGCGRRLEPDVYGALLPAGVREAWEQLLAEAQIPQGQRVYCPFPDCSALLINGGAGEEEEEEEEEEEDGDGDGDEPGIRRQAMAMAPKKTTTTKKKKKKKERAAMDVECPWCHRLFCLSCMVPWHAGITCLRFQAALAHPRHLSPNPNPNPNPNPGRSPSCSGGGGRDDLLLRALAKEKKWRTCSNCKHIIELNHGCMHITCRCGHEFCYKCGEKWTSNSHLCRSKKHHHG